MKKKETITKMNSFQDFVNTLSSDGGAILTLSILLLIHLIAMVFGYMNFSESYLLILGALLGIIRGEFRNRKKEEKEPEL